MSGISQWALSICAVAVLGAAFNMVFSDSKYDKVLRLVMSAVMVCVIISPITELQGCNTDVAADVESYSSADESLRRRIQEQSSSAVEGTLRGLINDELKKIGAQAEKIEISMDTEADGSISIGQVTVTVSHEDAGKAMQIKMTLEENLGLAAEVAS